ncbi:hypothetical protein D3C85_1575940 [compost metagenome]
MFVGEAGTQVVEEFAFTPGRGRPRQAVQGRRLPTIHHAAGQEGLAALLRAHQVARRMAGRAVAEAIDQVGAAIPLLAALRISLVFAAAEE